MKKEKNEYNTNTKREQIQYVQVQKNTKHFVESISQSYERKNNNLK